MSENEYSYELKYKHNDKEVSMKFSAEITLDDLVTNLQDFLKSCGWAEDSVIRQVRTESDIYEEDEKNKTEEIKSEYNLNSTYTDNNDYCHGYNYDTYCHGYNYNYNYYTDNNDYYRKSYDEDYIDG